MANRLASLGLLACCVDFAGLSAYMPGARGQHFHAVCGQEQMSVIYYFKSIYIL